MTGIRLHLYESLVPACQKTQSFRLMFYRATTALHIKHVYAELLVLNLVVHAYN
jgi:hypothetical protein